MGLLLRKLNTREINICDYYSGVGRIDSRKNAYSSSHSGNDGFLSQGSSGGIGS
jgi:hypothetical protein